MTPMIEKIIIKGNRKVNTEEILEMADIKKGDLVASTVDSGKIIEVKKTEKPKPKTSAKKSTPKKKASSGKKASSKNK